jgi:hypothetical protein
MGKTKVAVVAPRAMVKTNPRKRPFTLLLGALFGIDACTFGGWVAYRATGRRLTIKWTWLRQKGGFVSAGL